MSPGERAWRSDLCCLADWATGNQTLLASILERAAWRGATEADLRAAGVRCELVLLLDGWNELASEGRERAHTDLERLKAEMPELALLISTRRQALDVLHRNEDRALAA